MQSDEFLKLLDGPLDYDAWPTAPPESHPFYFRTWQHVSVALQRALRQWVPEFYFRDLRRLEDRDAGYAMVIYSACRLFYGRARTEFTYDIADERMLPAALRAIGWPIERTLKPLEARLESSGRAELGRQYSPRWYQDVLAAVKKRPQRLVGLLAREAKLIDAVIDLGTQRNRAAARQFAKRSSWALRNLGGVDMRNLLPRVLKDTTTVLAEQSRDGAHHDNERSILSCLKRPNALPDARAFIGRARTTPRFRPRIEGRNALDSVAPLNPDAANGTIGLSA